MNYELTFEAEPFELPGALDEGEGEFNFTPEFFRGETEFDEAEWDEREAPAYARAPGVAAYCPEYRRWVQQSLNRVLGLRLVVDGDVGRNTINAVKTFKRRYTAKPDGKLDLKLEEELVKAGAPPPPLSFPPPGPGAAGSALWVRALIPLLERHRGNIPLDFLLGWVAVESGGCVGVITASLNERGYFQIHPAELKHLKVDGHPADPERISTDPEYSVKAGIALVRYYMGRARSHLKIQPGSDLFWPMVKFQHTGVGYVDAILKDMRANGASPASWAAIRQHVADATNNARLRKHKFFIRRDPSTLVRNVDELLRRGRQLAPRQTGGTTPELYDEAESGDYELSFEAEPFQGYTEFDEAEWSDDESFESFEGDDEDWAGEQFEAPAPSGGPPRSKVLEQTIVTLAIGNGERDENRLTNQIFFMRYPARNGKPIARGERAAAAEWVQIRDTVVRPVLAQFRGTPPAPSPTTPAPTSTNVTQFATQLGATWSARRGGTPSAQAITDWLVKDHEATQKGAAARFKNKHNPAAITRAWMISREENMKFQLATKVFKTLQGFAPPSDTPGRTSSPLIPGSEKESVAPLTIEFAKQLKQRYPTAVTKTYRGHGGGPFHKKGYSLDIYIPSPLDSRGFYRHQDAVALCAAVADAARAVNAEWRLIYNDFAVANVVNKQTGQYRVVYVGHPTNDGKGKYELVWHGPSPLILHFHLDLAPRR